jgi:hypothetical protein
MPLDFFGFTIGKKSLQEPGPEVTKESDFRPAQSFVPPNNDDGSTIVESGGGHFGYYMDFDGSIRSDIDLINRYRSMSLQAEIEMAVDEITNEAIVPGVSNKIVELNLSETKLSEPIQKKVQAEFDEVLKLLNFPNKAYELFRKWYIDSRLYFHVIPFDEAKNGIKELRPIDPLKIKKIVNIEKEKDPRTGVEIIKKVEEFFVYTPSNLSNTPGHLIAQSAAAEIKGIKVSPDAICFVHSGLYDASNNRIYGYLQKAIKPINQLRMIEDAVVIYRLSRAPERRIFYIDVGSLPKNKAEQYLKDIMNTYRNKLVYDATTGEMRDDKKHMSMLEDFWLPRRDGGRGTEITTLDGGQNLGEMEDVEYFKKKLYHALNIPISRLESDNSFNIGKSTEITRDEVKFGKFIDRLRNKFSEIFTQLLRKQVLLKGIMTADEWDELQPELVISYNKDAYFSELKENEMMRERIELLGQLDDKAGKYYSIEWIRRNILRQSDELIKELDSQMKKEKSDGLYDDPDDENQNTGNGE